MLIRNFIPEKIVFQNPKIKMMDKYFENEYETCDVNF